MKRISVLLFLINAIWLPTANADEWGYIVKEHYDCENDHMAINTNKGWLLAEAYPPYSALVEGAYIFGDLTGYGFEDVDVYSSQSDTTPTSGRIYIDNYWMSEDDASYYCFTGNDL
jgi:hypothetical protein